MPEAWRPIIGRLVAALVGSVAAWIEGRWGFKLDEDSRITLVNFIVMLGTWGVTYALTHKAVNAKVNPADASTSKLAEQGKVDQRRPGIR